MAGHRSRRGSRPGPECCGSCWCCGPDWWAEQAGAIATRIGERVATDGETRARIDGLTFALEAAH